MRVRFAPPTCFYVYDSPVSRRIYVFIRQRQVRALRTGALVRKLGSQVHLWTINVRWLREREEPFKLERWATQTSRASRLPLNMPATTSPVPVAMNIEPISALIFLEKLPDHFKYCGRNGGHKPVASGHESYYTDRIKFTKFT